MKIRSSFVSNSSSSSFIIQGWFDMPESKRDYIRNYDKNAYSVMVASGRPLKKKSGGASKEPPFNGEEYWPEDVYADYPTNFGVINNVCRWRFAEYSRENTCVVSSDMDNFDMGAWLLYNGVDFEKGL